MSVRVGGMNIGVSFVGDMGDLQRTLDAADNAVGRFGKNAQKDLKGLSAEAGNAGSALDRLSTGLRTAFVGGSVAVGLITLKNTVAQATAAIVEAQVQVDRLRNGFKFGAGGAEAGAAELQFVKAEASRLGLVLNSTAGQYMKLVAASRGTSMAGEQAREVFTAVAEAAAVMGMNADQSERAMMAVTQMMSKGKVMAEELRGQLGEHLPGAFAIAARAMGVTEVELNKMLETGQVFSADFLPKFAAQLRKELSGSVEESAQSMQANLNRLSTAWQNLKQQFAQSGAGGFLSDQIAVLSGDLKVLGDVMEASRQRGEGFWMTLANTAGAAIGRATFGALELAANTANGAVFGLREQVRLMPDNLRSTAEQFVLTGQKIQQAQKEYDALSQRLAQAPDNIYIKSELGNLSRYIARLKDAQDEQRRLQGGFSGGIVGSVASGDVALARAQRVQYEKELAAREALRKKYATPQEKLNEELAAQKKLLGSLWSPAEEARIRASFGSGRGGRGGGGGGDLYAEASRYLESLQKQLQAAEELTVYEKLLADIQAGRLGKLTPQLRDQLETTARQIDADRELATISKQFNELSEQAAKKRAALEADGRRSYEATRTPIERLNIELARQDELLRKLGPAYKDVYMRANEAAQERYESETKATEQLDAMSQAAIQASERIQGALGDELTNILSGEFENIGDAFSRLIERMLAEAAAAKIMEGLFGKVGSDGKRSGGGLLDDAAKWLGSIIPSANGNVFPSGPGISAYSSQVVSKPTIFPFAKGIGLMGEAGAEAIMPLRRDAAGRLGVSAAGAGVTVNVINQSGQAVDAQQRSRTGADGQQIIDVVLSAVGDSLANRSGPVSRGLEAGYGIRPAMA